MNFHKFNIIIPSEDIETNPQCLQRIASGDRTAFEWLYKNYCGRLYEYLYLLTAEEVLSEDIVQDVFIKLWISRQNLAGLNNFNGYLYFMAKNHLLNIQKKKKVEANCLKEMGQLASQYTTADPLIEKEKNQMVSRGINSLTGRQKQVYLLVREEGRSRAEVSQALNISPFTVKNTMKAALKHLKLYLKEY